MDTKDPSGDAPHGLFVIFIKGCRCIPARELVIGAAREICMRAEDLDARLAELS